MRFLLTGGAGFIGSTLARRLSSSGEHSVLILDKLTYAARRESLKDLENTSRLALKQGDIRDAGTVGAILKQFRPDVVFHLAAESHVDRSIDGPSPFIQTNIVGTYVMVEESFKYFSRLSNPDRSRFRFQHISTDEVFGDANPNEIFDEESSYRPSSPYSASKAAADHLVRAWGRTFGLPYIISNASNNFGPYQHPEKLIPLTILRALRGQPIQVFGDGLQVRDWIFVEDHVDALVRIAMGGRTGETYNIGAECLKTNLEVVQAICKLLDAMAPRPDGACHAEAIRHVADRPGHDRRYSIDSSKIRRELDWTASTTFDDGLSRSVAWYLENLAWCEAMAPASEALPRLGLGSASLS